MRIVLAAIIALSFAPVLTTTGAFAQATCRNKCNSEEQSCLSRTNNKSQCGSKAQQCMAKCK